MNRFVFGRSLFRISATMCRLTSVSRRMYDVLHVLWLNRTS